MIKNLILYLCLLSSNYSLTQPWKLSKEFALAFEKDYSAYKLHTFNNNGKLSYTCYQNKDSSKKFFEYSTLLTGEKDGWFNLYDNQKNIYSILFDKDKAKKLSFPLYDGSIVIYNIIDDRLDGVHTIYYANGNLREYGFYKQNTRIGVWKFFFPTGTVESEGEYEGNYEKLLVDTISKKVILINNLLDTVKSYAFTPITYDSLKIRSNQPFGPAPSNERQFKNGVWKYYNINGQLVKEEYYKSDILIKSEVKKIE